MRNIKCKIKILLLIAITFAATALSCGCNELPGGFRSSQKDPHTFFANSMKNKLVASNNFLYTIVGGHLLRFHSIDGTTEIVNTVSMLADFQADQSMLFHSNGRLWLLVKEKAPENRSGKVQLAPLHEEAVALEEPKYTLPGWPDTAAFSDKHFLFSLITEQTANQAALHKLDIENGDIEVINSDSVFELVSGKNGLLYTPIHMEPLLNGQKGMLVPDTDVPSFICRYNPATDDEDLTTVEIDFPIFTTLGEQYVTIHEADGRADNYELRLVRFKKHIHSATLFPGRHCFPMAGIWPC